MKKKLLALALIMIVAVSGVFAEPVEPVYPIGEFVEAKLLGYIGDLFSHGFLETTGSTDYQTNYILGLDEDLERGVFDLNPIQLIYGFTVRGANALDAKMSISAFVHDGDGSDIVITGIRLDGTEIQSVNGEFTVLSYEEADVGSLVKEDVTITVEYDKVKLDTAKAGTYTSTITITIAGA